MQAYGHVVPCLSPAVCFCWHGALFCVQVPFTAVLFRVFFKCAYTLTLVWCVLVC